MNGDDDRLVSRRRFMLWAARCLAYAVTALSIGHGQAGRAEATDKLITRVSRPYDAETPVEAFTSWITPNDQFFVRSHFGPPPSDRIDPAAWRLRVAGLADRPLSLSLSDLTRFEQVSVTAVVQCSGNGRAFHQPRTGGIQWRKGAVGNARWRGVRLRDVLAQAGVLYFTLVFGTGFVLGTVRVLWLVPAVGTRIAEFLEAPIMFAVIILAARWIVGRLAVPPTIPSRLAVGGIALSLVLVLDFTVVLWIRGLSLDQYVEAFDPVAGTAYFVMLGVFALMPLFVVRRERSNMVHAVDEY